MVSFNGRKFLSFNKVNYSENDFTVVRNLDVPRLIRTEGSSFYKTDNILGQGGNGIVIEYMNKYGETIAIKIINRLSLCKDSNELLKKLSMGKLQFCDIKLIKQKCITSKKYMVFGKHITIVLMEKMDGDLKHLFKNFNEYEYNKSLIKIKNDVVNQVVEALICLQGSSECFLDLKLQNVFYRTKMKNGKKNVIFKLGDLDGISTFKKVKDFSTYGSTTYPPPESWVAYSNERRVKCTRPHIIWALGLFIAIVYIPDYILKINRFYWNHSNVKSGTKSQVIQLLSELKGLITSKHFPRLSYSERKILKKVFVIPSNKKRRPTLKQIYKITCKLSKIC